MGRIIGWLIGLGSRAPARVGAALGIGLVVSLDLLGLLPEGLAAQLEDALRLFVSNSFSPATTL